MVSLSPHYLLFCHTLRTNDSTADLTGRWHFVLERLDGPQKLEAADTESSVTAERLALLAVVRGLEAIEQPSQVTLVTTSRYVSRGLRCGLSNWRDADYTWERFGERLPVRNADLWRRVDGALQFHGVSCRWLQAEKSEVFKSATGAGNRLKAAATAAQVPGAPERRKRAATSVVARSEFRSNPLAAWWQPAAAWLRWRRGRRQIRPVFSGM